jgi:energy-coupling factor transporter transmembrane protein EcfT
MLFMVFFLLANIISLAVALWVFYDSQKRGSTVWRSLLWAVGVFFILIVFLPLYLAARKKKERIQAAAREAPPPSSLNLCFYCRQGYEDNPTVCPHCGQNLKM